MAVSEIARLAGNVVVRRNLKDDYHQLHQLWKKSLHGKKKATYILKTFWELWNEVSHALLNCGPQHQIAVDLNYSKKEILKHNLKSCKKVTLSVNKCTNFSNFERTIYNVLVAETFLYYYQTAKIHFVLLPINTPPLSKPYLSIST